MRPRHGTGVGIVGMGIGLPDHVRSNDFWPAEFVHSHEERAKHDLTTRADQKEAAQDVDPEVIAHAAALRADIFRGTKRRRVIADGERPSDIEVRAATAALARAAVDPEEVDLLLVYSLLPDVPAPLNHPLVAARLGLRRDLTALTVAAGCASFVSHLYLASRLIACGDHRTALIVQSAVMSPISDYSAPYSVVGGDGATAAVLKQVDEGLGFIAHHQDTRGDLHAGTCLISAQAPHLPWYRGDLHRDRLTAASLDEHATHVMGTKAATFCRETCQTVLDKAGYEASDVDFLATSQPTAWFGPACCDSLGIPRDRTLSTFTEVAHLMAASAPLNLWTAHERGLIEKGDLVLVYSPGAGFIQSALVYRWNLPRAAAMGGGQRRAS